MGMIFCRGCGKEIHESAPTCPHCGAKQLTAASSGSTNSSGDGFLDLGLQPLKKYADFKGRARRKEYWYFVLICFLVNFVVGFIGGFLGSGVQMLTGVITLLFALGTIIPSIAVGVRRMHDTDRSGWWILLPIVNLVFLCIDGQQGSNRFGDDPKSN
jgi:uncharacterized membrane protein YhaH (DUF805 family)